MKYDLIIVLGSQVTRFGTKYGMGQHTLFKAEATAKALRERITSKVIISGGYNFGVRYDDEKVLAKPDAKSKYRVVFGVQLPSDFCSVGACAQHNAKNDTWVLTQEIRQADNIVYGGHELIITGYDDNAIAIDPNGVKHTGLLILRNSWGAESGDHGDYYMSYDFFKALADEVFVLGYEPDEE